MGEVIDQMPTVDIRIIALKERLQLYKTQDDFKSLTMITLLSLVARWSA